MRHTFYYVQVGYFYGGLVGHYRDYYHEHLQDVSIEQSRQDFFSGAWGVNRGHQLADGEITLIELATQLRADLGE